MTDEEDRPFTHRATITVSSNGPEEEVAFRVHWEPDIDGKTIEEIGFLPAAYKFVQEYIVPAIEQAYIDYEVTPMLEAQAASDRIN